MSSAVYPAEIIKRGRVSVLLGDESEDPSVVKRVAWNDKCPGCESFFDEDRHSPAALLDDHGTRALCDSCVMVCSHDDCEEIIVLASYVIGDVYDAGFAIKLDPNAYHAVDYVCMGCYEDAYARCDCCEAHVLHADCGIYNVPKSRYVRDNGHGTHESWEFLPRLDVLADEDDALFARWVRETEPAYVGMSVCTDCVDSVESDVRRAEPFKAWCQAIETVNELTAALGALQPGTHAHNLRSLWLGDARRDLWRLQNVDQLDVETRRRLSRELV